MNQRESLGYASMMETIASGGAIDHHLNEILAFLDKGGAEVFAGALQCILTTYTAIRDAGLVPQFDDPVANAFLHAGNARMATTLTLRCTAGDSAWMNIHISNLVGVVHQHRSKVSFNRPVAKEVPAPAPIQVEVVSMPAPATIDVNVKSMPAPVALEMKIVSMPERVTESAITYDQKGDIKTTTQTEKDAV